MKKTFQIVLLSLAIILIKSEFDLCEKKVFSGDIEDTDCQYLSTGTDKTHCCLFEAADQKSRCMEITDDEYENIKRFKNYMKNDYSKVKIKCSADYLSFTLLALLVLLF